MHRQFHKLLAEASGRSEFVLAVNLDVRGFSDWSRRVESSQTTLYLAKIYRKLIDVYFPNDWFFKPTGDGLLLVRAFVEAELAELVKDTVNNCFAIVDNFGELCHDDPMINYGVPDNVGIGLAQGAASRLVAYGPDGEELTLDYSGRVLNLSSKLMELARPRGVVIDSGFGAGLLPKEAVDRLDAKTGYIRGVSPDDELRVLFDPAMTQIVPSFERRPDEPVWGNVNETWKLREMERYQMARTFSLASKLNDPSAYRCIAIYRTPSDRKRKEFTRVHITDSDYLEEAGHSSIKVDIPSVAKLLRAKGVKGTWDVTISIDYPVQ